MDSFDLNKYLDKLNEIYSSNSDNIEEKLNDLVRKYNIIFEYDEPYHYIDIENNILREKDLNRQKFLIDTLHCKFYRYKLLKRSN